MKLYRCAPPEGGKPPHLNPSTRAVPWLGLLFVPLLWALNAGAAAPPNDTCAGAETVPGGGPFPYATSIVLDVSDATRAGDPGDPSCFAFVSRSVWYRFAPQQTAFYRLSVRGDTATTVQDTVMALYTSSGGCAGPFTEIDCNDDSGVTQPHLYQSTIARTLQAGSTYYIVVWVLGDFPPEPGMRSVQLRVAQPQVPANDDCSGAEIIPAAGPFPHLTSVTDTWLATSQAEEPSPSCRPSGPAARSVWYRFEPALTALYGFSTCGPTATTLFDTAIAVYTSATGCAGPMTEVACDDDGCGFHSELHALLRAGSVYYIAVYDTQPEAPVTESEVQLRITLPPEASTSPASSITSASAVLNGIVRPNALATTYWFEWGPDTNYALPRTTLRQAPGTVSKEVTNAMVSPISPNAVYHFRLVATNENGLAASEDRTFVWDATPPHLETFVVTPIGTSVRFMFHGSPGQVYRVERSTNLIHWNDVGLPTDLGAGVYQFLESKPPSVRSRFYRVHVP